MSDPRKTALRLAAVYIVVAASWIVVSDWIAARLPVDVAIALQTAKGVGFVVVSGAVIYLLVVRLYERIRLEANQARSIEALFEQVVETVPVGIVFVNDDKIVTFVNSSAERLLSMHAGEAIGRSLEELAWESSPETGAQVSRLLDTGAIDGLALGNPDDPTPRAVIARAAAVDEAAASTGWVIAIADITETHRQGQRSERLMGSYRFLADALAVAGRETAAATLVSSVAQLAVERGGYSAAWAIFRPDETADFESVAEVQLGDHALETADQLRMQAMAEKSILSDELLDASVTVSNDLERDPANPWHGPAQAENIGSSAVFGVTGPGGMRASITLFARAPGHFDADEVDVIKQLRGALAFAFEKIALETHRQRAEEALECSEQAYRQLFVSHPAPLWVYDAETLRFLAVNEAARAKYGYSVDEFKAMTIADIRPGDEVPRLLDNVRSVQGGFEDAGIWTHVDKSGRNFPVHVYSHAIEWSGRQAELVMVQEVARVG